MRIKKLELIGFKSFKDRTVIQFDEGITGVVGPNGCGKSNIVDALVWVMGEMSAKHLRGSSMSDVIFSGAEGYAPMGMAEVSLTLENDGGPFPAKYMRYSEVMITRRLHRSGESEYLINKEPARLRDIQEIFMDTGAGSKGFSIIEQGAIGKIITAKPDDRRTLIEEAAGITKFKVRKRESQRKLGSTEQNLIRLQDILAEQKRQLDSLERQAQRAERYRKIKTELQDKDLWLSSQKYVEIHAETESAQRTLSEAETGEVSESTSLQNLELQVAEDQMKLSELEAQVQKEQTTHQEAKAAVQEAELKIKELQLEIDQAKRSNEMTGSMLSQYQARKEALETEKRTAEEKLSEARDVLTELEVSFNSENAEYEALQARIQTVDEDLTSKRREMLSLSTGVSHTEARLESLNSQLEERQQKLVEHSAQVEVFSQKKDEFTGIRKNVFENLESERQMHLNLTQDVDVAEGNLKNLRAQIDERKEGLDGLKDELNKVASRLYGLENLQDNFEGFEEGVKSILYWQRTRPEETQSFKPLAEVVEVPSKYELAMEASMGTRLQTLLSPNQSNSLDAVNYLKDQKNGRSSFLSGDMQVVEDNEWNDQVLKTEPGVVATLESVVEIPEHLKAQVLPIFKDIVVVESISSALNLRSRYPGRQFVTLEGDLLSADGVLTGGAAETAESGLLKRRREIKELSMQREELSGKVQLAQLNLQKLTDEEAKLTSEFEVAKKTAADKEIQVAELRKDLERAEMELVNAGEALRRQVEERDKSQSLVDQTSDNLKALNDELSQLHNRKNELEAQVQVLDEEFVQSKEGYQGLSQKVTDLKVKLARERQNVEGLERQVVLVSATYDDLQNQLAQMGEESKRHQSTLSDGQVLIENIRGELTRLIHTANEAERAMSLARNEYELYAEAASERESKLSELRSLIHKHQGALNDAKLKLEQLKMKEDFLSVQVQERYQLDLKEIFVNHKDVPGNTQEIEKEVEELRSKIKRIGEVNLSAIEEYDGLVERYEFLNQQYKDLMEAKDHLKKVIDRINRICSRRFKETFENVNERFVQVFPVLFGGGEARLILVEDPEKDEPGIDIVARPPGKKLQNVSLLSGGEKALTAVSLIFAIFLVKPSPFCLLDEVDAPLDDANVSRFNELVNEMARRSQMIVVTHNKHTMKVNDKLYGVTMQEKGVSKMVSVSLDDAEKLTEANG